MATQLNTIRDNAGARKRGTRKGIGIGSGKGKTGGRGVKGQKSRSGVAIDGFEGGQTPLYRRLPKRGFNNPNRVEYAVINLQTLEDYVGRGKLDAKSTINKEALIKSGVLKNDTLPVKLLGKGTLKTGVKLEIDAASKSAIAAVEKAGGSVTVVAQKKPNKSVAKTDKEVVKPKQSAAKKDTKKSDA